jgi:hypothetical protein
MCVSNRALLAPPKKKPSARFWRNNFQNHPDPRSGPAASRGCLVLTSPKNRSQNSNLWELYSQEDERFSLNFHPIHEWNSCNKCGQNEHSVHTDMYVVVAGVIPTCDQTASNVCYPVSSSTVSFLFPLHGYQLNHLLVSRTT